MLPPHCTWFSDPNIANDAAQTGAKRLFALASLTGVMLFAVSAGARKTRFCLPIPRFDSGSVFQSQRRADHFPKSRIRAFGNMVEQLVMILFFMLFFYCPNGLVHRFARDLQLKRGSPKESEHRQRNKFCTE